MALNWVTGYEANQICMARLWFLIVLVGTTVVSEIKLYPINPKKFLAL